MASDAHMFVFETRFPESTNVWRSSIVKKTMLLALPNSNGKLLLRISITNTKTYPLCHKLSTRQWWSQRWAWK